MTCIINSIKRYELGINLPVSCVYRYCFKDLNVLFGGLISALFRAY